MPIVRCREKKKFALEAKPHSHSEVHAYSAVVEAAWAQSEMCKCLSRVDEAVESSNRRDLRGRPRLNRGLRGRSDHTRAWWRFFNMIRGNNLTEKHTPSLNRLMLKVRNEADIFAPVWDAQKV